MVDEGHSLEGSEVEDTVVVSEVDSIKDGKLLVTSTLDDSTEEDQMLEGSTLDGMALDGSALEDKTLEESTLEDTSDDSLVTVSGVGTEELSAEETW
mgnify:FL=1